MNVALYLRVSTSDQTVENQVAPLLAECERRGWTLVQRYTDAAVSGAKASRPGLDLMLRDAARGEFSVVLAWSLDRLGRSLADLLQVSASLERAGCGLYLHRDNIDTTTASGRLYFSVMGALAQFERERLQERVHAGLDRARAEGKRLGRPPATEALVAKIEALILEGEPQRSIRKRLGVGQSLLAKVALGLKSKPRLAA